MNGDKREVDGGDRREVGKGTGKEEGGETVVNT